MSRRSPPAARIEAPPDAACVGGETGPWRRACAREGVAYEVAFGAASYRSALIDIDISEDQDGFTLAGPPRLSYGGSRKDARDLPPKAPSPPRTSPRIVQICYSSAAPRAGGQGEVRAPVALEKGAPRLHLKRCANSACRRAPASAGDDYDGAVVNAAAASARQ